MNNNNNNNIGFRIHMIKGLIQHVPKDVFPWPSFLICFPYCSWPWELKILLILSKNLDAYSSRIAWFHTHYVQLFPLILKKLAKSHNGILDLIFYSLDWPFYTVAPRSIQRGDSFWEPLGFPRDGEGWGGGGVSFRFCLFVQNRATPILSFFCDMSAQRCLRCAGAQRRRKMFSSRSTRPATSPPLASRAAMRAAGLRSSALRIVSATQTTPGSNFSERISKKIFWKNKQKYEEII